MWYCDAVSEQLRRNWFKPSEASAKRRVIQNLILELLQGRSLESLREYTDTKENSPNEEFPADEQLTRASSMSLLGDKQDGAQSTDELGPVHSNPSLQVKEPLIEICSYARSEATELHVDLCGSFNPDRQDEHVKLRHVDGSAESTECDDIRRDMHHIGSHQLNASWKSGADQSSAHVSVVNDDRKSGPDSVVLPDDEIWNHERCPIPRLSLLVINFIFVYFCSVHCFSFLFILIPHVPWL
jgi:hypothetical protein